MQNYTIRFIEGEPRFDVLGVMKLRCQTSVAINDRIYAQAQVGRNSDYLYLRILSFEPKPAEDATLSVILQQGEKALRLSVTSGQAVTAQCGDEDLTQDITAYLTQGEDLQGEYWGAVMLFSLKRLIAIFAEDGKTLPATLLGNVLREHPAVSSAVPLDEYVCFTFA